LDEEPTASWLYMITTLNLSAYLYCYDTCNKVVIHTNFKLL